MKIHYYIIVRENRPNSEGPQNYDYPIRIFHHTEEKEAREVAKLWGNGYKLITVDHEIK